VPEDLWLSKKHRNAFWQIAYHAIFYTHLYLHKDVSSFHPWDQHQADVQNPDGIASDRPAPGSTLPRFPSRTPERRSWRTGGVRQDGGQRGERDGPAQRRERVPWYKMSKLEHSW